MKIKINSTHTVTLAATPIDEVEQFTYLGSVVSRSTTGGNDQDQIRLGKAK